MWDKITTFLNLTGIEDKTVWQDVFFSTLLIPIAIFFGVKLLEWWNKKRPSRLVFDGCLGNNIGVYIFHSQMSSANDDWTLRKDPKYITRFPKPTPTDHANFGIQHKINIDPVSSGADSECVADVFNILGLVRKTKNIYIADLINDWNVWANPIFSVGFNPKTDKLIERCSPIFFELTNSELRVKNMSLSFDCVIPNDAGIIQKTFDKDSKAPVFILAGLGTTGTSAAGYILKNNFIKLGKLFGNNAFCVFFKVKIDEGKSSATIQKIFPKPAWYRIIMHPVLFSDFTKRGYFKFTQK